MTATRELGKGGGQRRVYIPDTDNKNIPCFKGNCNFQKKPSRTVCLISIGKSPVPSQAERMGWRRQGAKFWILKGTLLMLTSKPKTYIRERHKFALTDCDFYSYM